MFQIELQLVAAIMLAIVAIRMQMSLHRRRKRDWQSILKDFRDGHGYLYEIRKCVRNSKGEIWSTIGGVNGLYRMYLNMEVLLEAVNFISKQDSQRLYTREQIRQLREDSENVQISIVLLMLKSIVIPRKRLLPSVVGPTINSYLASVNGLGLLLEQNFPILCRYYRYFVSREVFPLREASSATDVAYEGDIRTQFP